MALSLKIRVSLLGLFGLTSFCAAQFPSEPQGITVLRSRFDNNISISYKENDICESTARSWSGYVHIPPESLKHLGEPQGYPINTFFWFFEARNNPENAPLSIYIAGGPGSSSMPALLAENGPCFVLPDGNSTKPNPWSWNNEVNMLYLDQPVQVGFSYDVLQNVTKPKLKSCGAGLVNATDPVPEQNASIRTYPSQNPNSTSLGTRNAAIALWQFSQTWFQEFPEYHSSRISLATESYGGRYGPEIFRFFEEQNQRIRNGSSDVPGETFLLHLDTLIIINGWVDSLIQWPTQPHIAYNNTYGIETINATIYQRMLEALDRPGGCSDQTYECREAASLYDPTNIGINETVNAICKAAYDFCFINLGRLYANSSSHGFYDYGTLNTDSGPPIIQPFHEAFLNQPHVQSALGVPLNYTGFSLAAWQAFSSTGDFQRSGSLDGLAYLLDKGVKVALVYGDRDFVCNWLGGEAVSLAINHTDSEHFRHAGYSPIQTNETYIGGQVRQYDNLSFSRVYEAGHAAAAYQPETVHRTFQRALFNKDIATGAVSTLDGSYTSTGPSDTWAIKNEPPSPRSG